jgi:hypothetical protein
MSRGARRPACRAPAAPRRFPGASENEPTRKLPPRRGNVRPRRVAGVLLERLRDRGRTGGTRVPPWSAALPSSCSSSRQRCSSRGGRRYERSSTGRTTTPTSAGHCHRGWFRNGRRVIGGGSQTPRRALPGGTCTTPAAIATPAPATATRPGTRSHFTPTPTPEPPTPTQVPSTPSPRRGRRRQRQSPTTPAAMANAPGDCGPSPGRVRPERLVCGRRAELHDSIRLPYHDDAVLAGAHGLPTASRLPLTGF